MTNEEKNLASAYAKLNGVSLSEAIKRAYFEKIEDEYDIRIPDEELANFGTVGDVVAFLEKISKKK